MPKYVDRSAAPARTTTQAATGTRSVTCGSDSISSSVASRGWKVSSADSASALAFSSDAVVGRGVRSASATSVSAPAFSSDAVVGRGACFASATSVSAPGFSSHAVGERGVCSPAASTLATDDSTTAIAAPLLVNHSLLRYYQPLTDSTSCCSCTGSIVGRLWIQDSEDRKKKKKKKRYCTYVQLKSDSALLSFVDSVLFHKT